VENYFLTVKYSAKSCPIRVYAELEVKEAWIFRIVD
jgi:hypothetical protein